MARLLEGGPVAAALREKTAAISAAMQKSSISPTLVILRAGQRPDDVSYARGATKQCAAAGVTVRDLALPKDVTQEEYMHTLGELNRDDTVHGILLMRPLPVHLDGEAARRALAPEKDVDGVTDGSLAGVFTGNGTGFAPCTARAVMEILDFYEIDPAGKTAVVLGRSLVVGRPAAMLLMARGATVTICHSQTTNAAALAKEADILVAAAGKMGLVGVDYLSPGQIVADVGIHYDAEAGRLRGDVDFPAAERIAEAVTPVPGGVGMVTSAVLASHTAEAARRLAGVSL